ncbi:unnamed protein product, partial [Closterium sp. NIES-54]
AAARLNGTSDAVPGRNIPRRFRTLASIHPCACRLLYFFHRISRRRLHYLSEFRPPSIHLQLHLLPAALHGSTIPHLHDSPASTYLRFNPMGRGHQTHHPSSSTSHTHSSPTTETISHLSSADPAPAEHQKHLPHPLPEGDMHNQSHQHACAAQQPVQPQGVAFTAGIGNGVFVPAQ